MTQPPLFRAEVLTVRNSAAYGSIVLARPASFLLVTIFSIAFFFLIIGYLYFFSFTNTAKVSGVVMPKAGLVKISTPVSARILEIPIKEGDKVKAGQVLFVLSEEREGETGQPTQAIINENAIRRTSLEKELLLNEALRAEQEREKAEKIQNLEYESANINDELVIRRSRLSLLEKSMEKFISLKSSGFLSEIQVNDKQDNLLAQRSELKNLERTLSVKRAELSQLQSTLRELPHKTKISNAAILRSLSALKQELIEAETKRRSFIVAQSNGTISTVIAEVGQLMNANQVLASLSQGESKFEVLLFASSKDIGFVKVGQTVKLRYRAYPYQKFGQHYGTVRHVSLAPLMPSEITAIAAAKEPFYRINVTPARQSVSAYGNQKSLQVGMEVDAEVELDTRSIGEWFFEPILSLVGKWDL